jgi:Asp-tRNA(Asn)/Glu-tRNA(Gln) amidotransferase A subunit family amidase
MKCELATIHRDRYARSAGLFGPKIGQFIEEGLGTPALDYVRALRMRAAYQREMLRLFETCDLLISPGAAGPAPEGIATTGDPAFSAPWTLADFPTLSIPIGVDARGLPIGIQISAPPLKDEVLLDSARRVESVIGFSLRPAWS